MSYIKQFCDECETSLECFEKEGDTITDQKIVLICMDCYMQKENGK
jgi:response regulator of citrate/malate metabolism